jgi:hypothetical protein
MDYAKGMEPQRNLTFDDVWAALMEDRKQLEEWKKENAREAEKRQQEAEKRQRESEDRQRETEKWQQESEELRRELDRQIKETSRKISDLGSRFGEMTEYMVVPNLVTKFRALGFVFEKTYLESTIKDNHNNFLAEVDITLENGDKVMIVEVKTKPSIDDIKDHVERMGKVRCHADLHDDKRKYIGAIAGLVIKENVKDFILKNGFYVIEPSNETFNITLPELPREW